MNVEDNCVWLRTLRLRPPPWDTANGAGLKSHAFGSSDVLHDGIERNARSSSSQASFVGFDGGTQPSHRGLVGRADGMERGCALLCEALLFKRCRHQISPLCWPFVPHRSSDMVGFGVAVAYKLATSLRSN